MAQGGRSPQGRAVALPRAQTGEQKPRARVRVCPLGERLDDHPPALCLPAGPPHPITAATPQALSTLLPPVE